MYIERENFINLFKGERIVGVNTILDLFYKNGNNSMSEEVLNELSSGINLNKVAMHQDLSEEFIINHKNKLSIPIIIEYQKKISVETILKCCDDDPKKIRDVMPLILEHRHFPSELYPKYEDYIDFVLVSKYQKLEDDVFEKYKDRFNWDYISKYGDLSEELIDRYKDSLDWFYISGKPNLTDQFVIDHKDYIIFSQLTGTNLSFEFIYCFQGLLFWNRIWRYRKFTMDEIKLFLHNHAKTKINWDTIIKHQNITKDFIREVYPLYSDKIDLSMLLYYRKDEFNEEFIRSLDVDWNNAFLMSYKDIHNDSFYHCNLFDLFYDKLTFEAFSVICENCGGYHSERMIEIFKKHPDDYKWHYYFFDHDDYDVTYGSREKFVMNNRSEVLCWYLGTYRRNEFYKTVVEYIENNYCFD